MTSTLPDFTPAQPSVPGIPGGCGLCGNPGHSTDNHALLEVLNRQTELLSVMAGILEPKRYRLVMEGTEDGTGKGTVFFDHIPGGVNNLWLAERTVVWTNSSGTPVVGIYVTDSLPLGISYSPLVVPAMNARDLVDYTNNPVAAGDDFAPYLVKGGEKIVAQWTGLSAGARVVARVQVRQAWQSVD